MYVYRIRGKVCVCIYAKYYTSHMSLPQSSTWQGSRSPPPPPLSLSLALSLFLSSLSLALVACLLPPSNGNRRSLLVTVEPSTHHCDAAGRAGRPVRLGGTRNPTVVDPADSDTHPPEDRNPPVAPDRISAEAVDLVERLVPVSYTHLTLPTILRV